MHLIIESREVIKTAIQSLLLVPSTCFVEIKDNSRHKKYILVSLSIKTCRKKNAEGYFVNQWPKLKPNTNLNAYSYNKKNNQN